MPEPRTLRTYRQLAVLGLGLLVAGIWAALWRSGKTMLHPPARQDERPLTVSEIRQIAQRFAPAQLHLIPRRRSQKLPPSLMR